MRYYSRYDKKRMARFNDVIKSWACEVPHSFICAQNAELSLIYSVGYGLGFSRGKTVCSSQVASFNEISFKVKLASNF